MRLDVTISKIYDEDEERAEIIDDLFSEFTFEQLVAIYEDLRQINA